MKNMNGIKYIFLGIIIMLMYSNCKDEPIPTTKNNLVDIEYNPTSFEIIYPVYVQKVDNRDVVIPRMSIPEDNALTEEGVDLGRHLFYDTRLSGDNTMSCGSCHLPIKSFTDNLPVSVGIDGISGTRSSMSLLNIGFFDNGFFWDGRSPTLEKQALEPVIDPVELHETWPNVISKLKEDEQYPTRFRKAFGIDDTSEITKELAAKALAQFERSIYSFESKFDQYLKGEIVLSDDELMGLEMYIDSPGATDAQCAHCHNLPLMTSIDYFNNGLQQAETLNDFFDNGQGEFSSIARNGFFKAPSLRNIELTAPYMHNGSLSTLEEVIEHYNSGGKSSPNKDPLLNDIHLDEFEKQALIAFLKTLTDIKVIELERLQDPF